MPRLYRYVGPEAIRQRTVAAPAGTLISCASHLGEWLTTRAPKMDEKEVFAVTFIIDRQGRLCVADRRSEHVACAAGQPVLSAGELFLKVTDRPVVVEASNQSTGYCPEPESWVAVEMALNKIGVEHPGKFTCPMTFRRCEQCGQINIVKELWFVCQACDTDLPEQWNVDESISTC